MTRGEHGKEFEGHRDFQFQEELHFGIGDKMTLRYYPFPFYFVAVNKIKVLYETINKFRYHLSPLVLFRTVVSLQEKFVAFHHRWGCHQSVYVLPIWRLVLTYYNSPLHT